MPRYKLALSRGPRPCDRHRRIHLRRYKNHKRHPAGQNHHHRSLGYLRKIPAFFQPKFYGYADADLTKDRIAFLDFRFAPSVGVGYQWFDKAPFKFGTEAGVAWLYQKYTNGTPTHEPLAFKAAYHLTYDFNDKVSLFNDVTYFPTVPHVADYVINADIGLHTKLSKKLFCELKVEWDYDSTPANGALKNDTRYIANIGYSL